MAVIDTTRCHRRRSRRIRRGVLRRRPRDAGHAHRPGSQSRRRLPLSRLHPVQGAAARRQGPQRSEARRRRGASPSASRRSTSTGCAPSRPRSSTQLTGGLGQLSKQRKITYVQGTASFVDAKTLERHDRRTARRTGSTFEHAIIATGSHPAKVPGLSIDSPRVMDSTGGARPARHPQVAARRRRRLHRPRTGHGLRRARHQGHGRRDDRRAAAGRRSRPGQRPRASGSSDLRGGAAEHARSSG